MKLHRNGLTRSFGKLRDLFTTETDNRKSDSAILTTVSVALVGLLADKFVFADILMYFNKTKFMIIQDETEVYISDTRTIVWRLEKNRRIILETIVRKMKESNSTSKELQYLVFNRAKVLPPQCEKFASDLFKNTDVIFSKDGDPTYDENGAIIECTKTQFFIQYFDPFANEELIRIMKVSSSIIATHEEMVKLFVDQVDRIIELSNDETVPKYFLSTIAKRAQLALLSYLETHRLTNPEKNKITCAYSSEFFTTQFLLDLQSLMLEESPKTTPRTTRTPKRQNPTKGKRLTESKGLSDSLISHSQIANEEIDECDGEVVDKVDYSNLVSLNAKTFSEQLVQFDYDNFMKLEKRDLVDLDKSKSVSIYLQKLKGLELMMVETIKDEKSFGFFLKVADDCLRLGDYNIAHLIFSAIIKQSITFQKEFAKLSKAKTFLYNKLYEIFSIEKNMARYRASIKRINTLSPRIPIFSVFLKDMISIQQFDTFTGEKLNYSKMKTMTDVLEVIEMGKMNNYSFSQIEGFQNFLKTSSSM
ncbi:hypothetical protein EIN_403290 [Entamoeba invadens IP1]|uniref:Ras-GEF domain-containing protein n=1 Tax=Entamoeba invadens IP1 TaxID=370355 RepID=A0A0A1U6Q9_ENTIV|nr:hypothetical protein EIN_403290 [Entamoeba invadens IP1]ELP90005.1 hypothetical protein EIN_403290 [Entamoeba invadens IP1]|eukprot:XP_004256776.1 hypothetical protein EIN_403290 [Entamoeba invadens IP1]